MALVELTHSGTKFAEITAYDGAVLLNTKDKIVKDNILVTANIVDDNLIPANIRSGVSIFGVDGTLKAPIVDTTYSVTSNTSYTVSGSPITINTSGNYMILWFAYSTYSASYPAYVAIYKNGAPIGEKAAAYYNTSGASGQVAVLNNVELAAGDVIQRYAKVTRSGDIIFSGLTVVMPL